MSCSGGGQRWFKTKKSLVGAEFQNTWSSKVYRGDSSLKGKVLLMFDFQEAAFVGTEFLPTFQSLTFKYFFNISRSKVKNRPYGVHTLNMEWGRHADLLRYSVWLTQKRMKPLSGQKKEYGELGKRQFTCWCLALLPINHLIQHTPR